MSTLDLLLSTAVVNGLRQFNVTRIGTSQIQWQAATRWHGRDGYAVAIRDTPEEAATEALSAHPLPSSGNATTEAPHAYAAAGAPDPDMSSLDDWDDPIPVPPAAIPETNDADDLDGW